MVLNYFETKGTDLSPVYLCQYRGVLDAKPSANFSAFFRAHTETVPCPFSHQFFSPFFLPTPPSVDVRPNPVCSPRSSHRISVCCLVLHFFSALHFCCIAILPLTLSTTFIFSSLPFQSTIPFYLIPLTSILPLWSYTCSFLFLTSLVLMATESSYYHSADHASVSSEGELSDPQHSPRDHRSNSALKKSPSNPSDNDFVVDNDSNDNHHNHQPQHRNRAVHTQSSSPASRSPSPDEDRTNRSTPDRYPNHTSPPDTNSHRQNSRDASSSDDDSESSDNDADDDSSYQKDDADDDDEDDDDGPDDRSPARRPAKRTNGVASRQPERSSSPAHTNGHAPQTDSDDASVQPSRQRRNRRTDKLIIPDDMRDDDQYFRRSSRSRTAPHRFASPAASASSIGSDLDFNADEGKPYKSLFNCHPLLHT